MLHSQETREINRVEKMHPCGDRETKTTVHRCEQRHLQYTSTSEHLQANSHSFFLERDRSEKELELFCIFRSVSSLIRDEQLCALGAVFFFFCAPTSP